MPENRATSESRANNLMEEENKLWRVLKAY